MSAFAKNLRKLRKERNYTQKQLGERIQQRYTDIAAYETGKKEPSADTLIALAKALGVSIESLRQ